LDAATIYHTLENEIIPLYYARNSKGLSPEWVQYIKNSISQIAPHFTMKRMLDDYINNIYNKLAVRSARLKEDDFAKAKEIAAWKEEVAEHWDRFEIESFMPDKDWTANLPLVGKLYTYNIVIDRKELQGLLGVDMVITWDNPVTHTQELRAVHPFELKKTEGSKLYFELKVASAEAGIHRVGFRVYPVNPELPHRMDFAYVRWITV